MHRAVVFLEMGLFGKERTGVMQCVGTSGRYFQWKIPHFGSLRAGLFDSENATAFCGAQFHFHMVLGPDGDIGFYLHFKSPPIPKYSYFFSGPSSSNKLNQHTAHTIPADTERCGHWNMCSITDVKNMLGDVDELVVHFIFDDDRIVVTGIEEVKVDWLIPGFLKKNLSPFCSHGFSVNGMLYVLRVEEKADDLVFFIYCRKGMIPPHSLAVHTVDGGVLGGIPKALEPGAQMLKIPRSIIEQAIGHDGQLVVTAALHKSSNPLEFLNTAAAAGGPPAQRQQVHLPGKEKETGAYDVMEDDV